MADFKPGDLVECVKDKGWQDVIRAGYCYVVSATPIISGKIYIQIASDPYGRHLSADRFRLFDEAFPE